MGISESVAKRVVQRPRYFFHFSLRLCNLSKASYYHNFIKIRAVAINIFEVTIVRYRRYLYGHIPYSVVYFIVYPGASLMRSLYYCVRGRSVNINNH